MSERKQYVFKVLLSLIPRHLILITHLSSLILFLPAPAHADLIRDAEIEHTLRAFGDPIFEAADLQPRAVHMFIIGNSAINAFAAGGQNIFLHTGLILACTDPSMLLGVIAHETGHIAGGHLARGAEQLRNAQMGMLLSYVLSAAAGVAGGGAAGMAILSGSQNMLNRSMLSYSRGHEQAADQAGLGYLDRLGISASGMQETFALLRRNEMKLYGTPDPYAQTHPLSAERIEHVRNHIEHSTIPAGSYPKALDMPFQRMRAKLYSFLEIPPKTFARYPESDKSLPARMARAIAWYKKPEIDRALAEMQQLIKENPGDAFLYDLLGQIQFENGRIREAEMSYSKAAALAPDSPLILSALGEAQIALNDPKMLVAAVTSLELSNTFDNTNPRTWRLLATAYGKQKNTGMSYLALAEEAALNDKPEIALAKADLAIKQLKENTPSRLRAEDLKRLALDMKEKKDDE